MEIVTKLLFLILVSCSAVSRVDSCGVVSCLNLLDH